MYICEGLQEESSAAPPPQVYLRFSHLLRQVGAVLFKEATKCTYPVYFNILVSRALKSGRNRNLNTVPRAQKKETQARANCSAVPTQLALCLRLAIDL